MISEVPVDKSIIIEWMIDKNTVLENMIFVTIQRKKGITHGLKKFTI